MEPEVFMVRVGDVQVEKRADGGFFIYSAPAHRVLVSDEEAAGLVRVLTGWPGTGPVKVPEHAAQDEAISVHDAVALFGWSADGEVDWIVRKGGEPAAGMMGKIAAAVSVALEERDRADG